MKTLTTLESRQTDGKPDIALAQQKLKPDVYFLWRVWNFVKDVKSKIDLLLWKVEFDQKKLLGIYLFALSVFSSECKAHF
jgi:hypothetical protein